MNVAIELKILLFLFKDDNFLRGSRACRKRLNNKRIRKANKNKTLLKILTRELIILENNLRISNQFFNFSIYFINLFICY